MCRLYAQKHTVFSGQDDMSLGPGSDHSPGLRLGSLLLCEAADRPVRGAGRAALHGSAAATAVVLWKKMWVRDFRRDFSGAFRCG